MSRRTAIWATAVALALINVSVASLIVAAIGASSIVPVWLAILMLIAGIAVAVGAVLLWRQYLAETRHG